LQIDYNTHQFDGGKELFFTSNDHSVDTIPILMSLQGSGDFTDMNFTHVPSNTSIFDGLIVWEGCGSRSYPVEMDPSSQYNTTSPYIKPSNNQIKLFYPTASQLAGISIPYNQIWYSVSHLSKVKYYMDNDAKIGLFLYTASVGVGDPATWDWYLFFYL
jgi:hypothetical protein